MFARLLCTMSLVSCSMLGTAVAGESPVIRVGIIGLDTSHVGAFTSVLNREGNTGDLAGVRVTAAYPGGSPDIPASADRVEGFTKDLADRGVVIVDSIDALLAQVDAVLLAEFQQVVEEGEPFVHPRLAPKRPAEPADVVAEVQLLAPLMPVQRTLL